MILVFPENVDIETKFVCDQSFVPDSLHVKQNGLTIEETHPQAQGLSYGHYVYWMVGRNDVRQGKKGPVKPKKKNYLADEFGFSPPGPSPRPRVDDPHPDQTMS